MSNDDTSEYNVQFKASELCVTVHPQQIQTPQKYCFLQMCGIVTFDKHRA